MKQYLELLEDVLENGVDRIDRTGVGTRSVFGRQIRMNLQEGFPLLTTKRIQRRSVITELLWFLKGRTDNNWLNERKVNIWNEWADPGSDNDLGPIYGKQWRSWDCPDGTVVDQIVSLIEQIKNKPHSRRLIVSAWNPADLPEESISPQENVKNGKMALAPCHCLFQFYVANNKLSCQLYQRSADLFLGVPFNITSYSLLTYMIARHTGLEVGDYIHTFGDLHLYKNHLTEDIVFEQLKRSPGALPKLEFKRMPETIFDYEFEDFEILGYDPQPAIKAPIAM